MKWARRTLTTGMVALLTLVACSWLDRRWPSGAASEFFPQEPHHTLAREIRLGGGSARLRDLIPKRMDLDLVSQPARVPWSIKPEAITLLLWATMSGNADTVQVLLERGADPNRVSKPQDMTPLFFAVQSQDERLMRSLIRHGAEMNVVAKTPGIYLSTPLIFVFEPSEVLTQGIRSGRPLTPEQRKARAGELLRAGADVNQILARSPRLDPSDP